MNSIVISTSNAVFVISLQNIIRIQSSSNYSKIFFADKSNPLLVSKVLMWFEQTLPAENFVRIHRSHLINKKFINNFLDSKVHLMNGDFIDISRRRQKGLKLSVMPRHIRA